MLDRVSIIIVTYKADEVLCPCVESLADTCGTEPEVGVVDHSPSEATRRLVARYPNAIYVQSPGNPGFAGGNNIGLRLCTGKYVLLLNNDTVIRSSRSIKRLVEFLETHPNCGIVQGSIVLPNADGMAGGCGSFLTPFGFQYARGFAVPLDAPGVNVPTRCFSVMGAFMMFPRELVTRCGGFLFYDHFKSYYEESDFCHRAWLAGKEVWYVPTEPIEHLCGYTSGGFSRTEIMRQYIRNSFFSLHVNLGLFARCLIVSAYRCVMLAHSFVHLLRGDFPTFKADMSVFCEIRSLKKDIRDARRKISREKADGWVLRRILRLPSVSYMIRSVRGNA